MWVLNGTSAANRGAQLAGYLEYHGLAASAPRGKPEGRRAGQDRRSRSTTAPETRPDGDDRLPRGVFDVKVKTARRPGDPADVVVTIGRDTPELEPPPSS